MEDINLKTIGEKAEEKETPTLMERIKKDKIRIHRTINLYLGFIGLGVLDNLTGATLPDLARNVQASTTQIGYVITCKYIGNGIGCLTAGWIFGRCHRLTLFSSLLFTMCAINVAVPFIHDLYFLIAVVLALSMVTAAFNTTTMVLCLDIWMENSAPFFQALHLTYGLGSILGPLIAEPFLSPEDTESNNTTTVNSTEILFPLVNTEPVKDIGNVKGSYCIVSGVLVAVIISSVIAILIDRTEIKSNTDKKRDTNQVPGKCLPRCLIGLGMLFLAGYVTVEGLFAQFLVTFVTVSSLKMSKSTGSFMTSTFRGTFCFGRALGVYLATKFKVLHLLYLNLSIMSCAVIILAIFGESHAAAMWTGSAILGLGCASTYPSMFSFMEKYVGITNFVSGLLVVSGNLSGTLFSLIVTQFMSTYAVLMLYILCICCGICICALAGQLRVVSYITGKRGVGRRP